MIKNYYLFKKQVDQIQTQIIGSKVVSVFTTNKDELIFELENEESRIQLKVSLSAQMPYILLDNARKQKSDRLSFFENIYGKSLSGIKLAIYNKFIIMEFGSFHVHIWFYGSKPNIVLFDEKKNPIESFKPLVSITNYPNEIPIPFSSALLTNVIKTSPHLTVSDIISALLPAFTKRMIEEICFRITMECGENAPPLKNMKVVYSVIHNFLSELETGSAFIYRKDPARSYLIIYESFKLIDEGYKGEAFPKLNKAWSIFTYEVEKNKVYNQLYKKLSQVIDKKVRTLEVALKKIGFAENIEARKKLADLKGNLILTNKHKIPRAVSSVELVNIFSDEQETIRIKLNPKKKAVENATYYFEKYKEIADKKKVIKLKKATYQNELNEIKTLKEKTENANVKDLLKVKDKLIQMNILQDNTSKKSSGSDLQYSFRRLILENKWDIYIGKNSINNDLLTFSFANKWDIWMHAQGVPGSHIIIKVPGKNVNVPHSIIEQAAQIAASNSRAKHSATVPVIYTENRYVSRIRKALPGTVNVRNEKVIFVKPLSLNF